MNPFYFGSSNEPLFGVYHTPIVNTSFSSAVLLCPPIAQEYTLTHWSYRRLADLLAKEGFHVLRFDYFGTGDSAGYSHDATVERWHENIKTAANELLDLSGCRSISIVGLRTGAALAATTEGLMVHDFILWDTVINGSMYIEAIKRMENYNIIEFPFSTTVRNSIKEMNLISDYTLKAKNIFIFSAGILEYLEQFKEMLRSGDADVTFKYFDDIFNWNKREKIYDTFLPDAIPRAIVNALVGREF